MSNDDCDVICAVSEHGGRELVERLCRNKIYFLTSE